MNHTEENVNHNISSSTLLPVLSDIIMSHIPHTFHRYLTNDDNKFIRSINEFVKTVTIEDYTQFLNTLKSLSSKTIIDAVDLLITNLDSNKVIDNDTCNNKHNDTYVFIHFIIKKIIKGLLELAIIIDPLITDVSNSYISQKNWNMVDTLCFETIMKDIHKYESKNILINNAIENYLIQSKDIMINNDNNDNNEKIIISDNVKTVIQKIINESKTICLVLDVADSLFSGFVGYASIKASILDEINDLIIITACDMAITQGRSPSFMEKNAVITSITSTLNAPYRPIIGMYLTNSNKIQINHSS